MTTVRCLCLLLSIHSVLSLLPTDVESFVKSQAASRRMKGPTRREGPESIDRLIESKSNRITKRDARFFIGSGGVFEIALSFKIPFILIPISDIFSPFTSTTSARDTSGNKFGNLGFDTSSLLLVGLLGTAGALLFPGLGDTLGFNRVDKTERGEDVYQMNMIDKMNNYLKLYDIDGDACMNMAVCNGAKTSRNDVLGGEPTPTNKIVDGLLSYGQIKSLLDKTRFNRAIDVGLRGGRCDYKFDSCPFTIDMMESIVNYWLGYSLGGVGPKKPASTN